MFFYVRCVCQDGGGGGGIVLYGAVSYTGPFYGLFLSNPFFLPLMVCCC